MRPIKLKIKGLNSFIEEQTIDFKKLTENGFFGIFGPTGSGKSTVLDGITLALYGSVARNSSNYINTNCNSASVAFEFEISGANPKRYIVEREFKTDKKSGNPRSGKCKVMDVTRDEPIVLADSVGGVTATCKEIIGLNLDDFTRTVVLPQGKFSEFLKLEGKERRNMLERLFNLQQYGDDLTKKLVREINKEKTENSILSGQLKGYEDINEEIQKSKENEVAESKKKYLEAKELLEKVKKVFSQSEEIWNLQIELNEHKVKEETLKNKEEIIEDKKKKITLAESAEKVIPYINAYEKTEENLKSVTLKSDELKKELESLEKEKELALKSWGDARRDKEEKLPTLKLKEQEAKNALDEKSLVDNLQSDIDGLNKKIKNLKEEQSLLENKISELKKVETTLKNEIKEAEVLQDTLKVDSSLKEKVQQGVRVAERVSHYLQTQKTISSKIDKLNNDIAKDKESETESNNTLKDKNTELEAKEGTLKELTNKSPGETIDLVNMQKELSACEDKWSKYNTYIKEIEDTKKTIEDLNYKLKYDTTLGLEMEKEIDEIKAKIKEQETENLANTLRESLMDGDACPVCGSTHHEKENIKNINLEGLDDLEKQLKLKEKEIKVLVQKNISAETNISVLSEKISDAEDALEVLGDDFKSTTVEEVQNKFNTLKNAIKEYSDKKLTLENEITSLKETIGQLKQDITIVSTTIIQNEKQLKEELSQNELNNELLAKVQLEFKTISEETGVTDFEAKYNEIQCMERQHEELSLKIKELRVKLQKSMEDKLNLEKEFNKDKELLVSNETSLIEKEKNRDEKIKMIKTKVQDIDNIHGELSEIEIRILQIEKAFKASELAKDEIEKRYNECRDNKIKISTTSDSLEIQLSTDEKNLNTALKNENYNSTLEAKENILSKITLNELKVDIEKYNEEKSKIKGAIEIITSKLKGRSIEVEQWESVKDEKKNKELEYDDLNEKTIKLEEELKRINNKLIELGDLLKKKEKIDHKLGILLDLDKLFKGKKFVEFVAATRLKYVSIEASKRLKEITNGSYGLEVDQDGKFIIRDYKNGGAERDASTLSGGETFVASLALALALSSEIQLKGTAPLELFFLDEGFGTLDDNLLEVVMSSLERIHNDKLKIGLISHVESIKNRVPIRLILTPAVSGLGGSKVKIDKS